jgi:cytochrome c5
MRKASLIGTVLLTISAGLIVSAQGTGQKAATTQTAPAASSASAVKPAAPPSYEAAKAVLDEYCVECHNKTAKTANLAIDTLNIAHVQENVKDWEKIVRKLRAGMMPPAGQERPDKETYMALITWLENELDRTSKPFMPPPGVHRLNRTEYANAIQDLLDLSIDPAQYLPSDDSTRGFDNIASALTVSSTLVDSWVSAAGKISRLAIGDPATASLKVYRAPEDLTQNYHVAGLPFGTRGGLLLTHIFPSDGEYNILIESVFGDNMAGGNFGSVPCEKIEVLLDGERVSLIDWVAGRNGGNANCGGAGGRGNGGGQGNAQRGGNGQGAQGARGQQAQGEQPAAAEQPAGQQAAAEQGGGAQGAGGGRGNGGGMRVRVTTTAGPHEVGVTFLATNLAPLLDMNQQFLRSTVQTGPTPGFTFYPHVGSIKIDGPYNAKQATDSPSRRKIFICKPTGKADEAACARRIVTNLTTQAYRRTATSSDLELLMNFYQESRSKEDFDHSIANVLAHLLASPQFLTRTELEPATAVDGQSYSLSDAELASRLSFFLWSRGPDKTLRDLAAQKRLSDPVVFDQQVRRMLKDPRAEALTTNFAGQWLDLRRLDATSPLPMLYPDFDDPLRQAMRREVEMLFDSIRTEDRSIVDLLTADYTFVNERLAKHYGIPNIYGSYFRRISLGPDMESRKGLLGKGAVLATTAKPDRNSPVTRGKWVISTLLGVPPPDPPPNVPLLMPKLADARGNAKALSMRQSMLDHRVREDCIRCHSLMDPIGFILENYDAIGLWRTTDAGEKIAGSEVLYDGTKVEGPAGLRQWVVGYSDQYVRVATEKLLTYALGRGVEPQDMPLIRKIVHDSARSKYSFSSLVLGVVKSEPFRKNMKLTSIGSQKEAN